MLLRRVKFDAFKQIGGDLYEVIGYDGYCNTYQAKAIVKDEKIESIIAGSIEVFPFRFGITDNIDLISSIHENLEALSKDELKKAI